MDKKLLHNRAIAIATMHSKETVIATLLEKSFQLSCSVPELNTDFLGTFSGEIKRVDSPLDAARKKCNIAMELTGFDLAIASEGSFGAHPTIPFVHANEELVLLIDRTNNLEIFATELTTDTNFSGCLVTSIEEAVAFSKKAQFPSHGLIIRDQENSSKLLFKGIQDSESFETIISDMLRNQGQAWIETDMRALYNPTRMKAIERATIQLVEKLESQCPSCSTPGFWITERIAGLPCSLCYQPTNSTLAHQYVCSACNFAEEKKYPREIQFENPIFCDVCNP